MSDYFFRGQPISGVSAYVLLGSIKRVQEEAPNPTAEEIKALEEIVADFDKKFEEGMKELYPYPEEENIIVQDEKIYVCPKCSNPMYKQKSYAIWWCNKCEYVYDAWYEKEEPNIMDFTTKET